MRTGPYPVVACTVSSVVASASSLHVGQQQPEHK